MTFLIIKIQNYLYGIDCIMVTLGALHVEKKNNFLSIFRNQYKNNHFRCCGLFRLINSNEQLTDTNYDFFSYVKLKYLVHLI